MSSLAGFDDTTPLTRADLDLTRRLVEDAVGRPLRLAEQAIDVLGIDQALNTAKDDVEKAIRAEMIAASERALLFRMPVRIELTARMLKPLEQLFRLGRREAYAELQRLGYKPRRGYVAQPQHPELDPLADEITAGLNGLSIRVESELVTADLADITIGAITQALLHVPGARFIAAAVISRSFTAGLAQTFEANEDLIDGWEYTAVLDSGNCDPCGALDGSVYPSWEAIQEVLPNGGPNPDCDGGNRCRCRPVPASR